jgi:hypothetical protein
MQLKHDSPAPDPNPREALEAHLADAVKLYNHGGIRDRQGATIKQIVAIIDYLRSLGISPALLKPVDVLVARLNEPLLKELTNQEAEGPGGRPQLPHREENAQEAAAVALEIFIDTRLGRESAENKITRRLNNALTHLGINGHPYQSIAGPTIRNWRTTARKKSRVEARVYWERLEEWRETRRFFEAQKERVIRPQTLEGLAERFVDKKLIPDMLYYLDLIAQGSMDPVE